MPSFNVAQIARMTDLPGTWQLDSWVVDATRWSACEFERQCQHLLALPLPPTHWVRCVIDDDAAEAAAEAAVQQAATAARAACNRRLSTTSASTTLPATTLVAEEDTKGRRLAVRRHLREWKTAMLGIYKLQPAHSFVRVQTTGEASSLQEAFGAIVTALLSTAEASEAETIGQTGAEDAKAMLEPDSVRSGRASLERHRNTRHSSSTPSAPAKRRFSPLAPSAANTAAEFSTAARDRVSDIADDWRSRSLLDRLSRCIVTAYNGLGYNGLGLTAAASVVPITPPASIDP